MITPDHSRDDAYYTVSQAADKLGVTPQRVRQLCDHGGIDAVKKDGRWWVPRLAVHERFALRPPKARAEQEKALEELRSQIRELREENRSLAVRLEVTRASEANLREEVEDLTRNLEERERELAAEREGLEKHRRSTEELSRALEESQEKIEELERQVRDGSPVPFGSRQRRLIKGPSDAPESRRKGPPE